MKLSIIRRKNPYSKWQQKQAIKKEYAAAKAGHTADQTIRAGETTAKAAKRASEAGQKVSEFVSAHKKGFLIVGAIAAMLLMLLNVASSCSVLAQGGASAVGMSTYPSADADMLAAEAQYCAMEAELQQYLDTYESTHDYDEYHFDLDDIEHDPYVLISAITVLHGGEWQISEIGGTLQKQHRPRKKKDISLSENIQRVIDLEAVRARDKGIAYERWATNFNSKAASKSLLYLQTNYGGSYEKLAQAADEMSAHGRVLSGQMAAAQKRLEEIDVLRRHILNYAHTRDIFQQYKDSRYSKKFLAEHRQEIETHRAAKRAFNELGLKKLPSKKALDAEYSKVLAEKKSLYAAYCEEQKKLKELLAHRENLRPYLAPQEPQTQKRKEQDER